jgi:hypothetical protein
MKRKLKASGAGLLLAAIAISALAAIDAGANGEGHFVTNLTHATVEGIQPDGIHKLHFLEHGTAGEVGCDSTWHRATAISPTQTVTELIFTPEYGKCYTTGAGEPGSVSIHVNGCTYKFTVAKGTTNTTEQTLHLQCPPAAAIKITHPNCTITIHPQTINTGITYTKDVINELNSITLDSNAQVALTKHGLCQFLGTNAVGTIKGQIDVVAYVPKSLTQVNLWAT